MKKVIIEQNEKVIRLKDITDDMIIGILWENDSKSFLIKNHENMTLGIGLNRLTTLNKWTAKNHKDYIKKPVILKIYLFLILQKSLHNGSPNNYLDIV